MNPKFQLLKHTIALWTLLGVGISFLAMLLLSGPGEIEFCTNCLAGDFEHWIEVLLLINGILWGVGMWIWQIRIYLKSRKLEEKQEEEEWGV